MKQRNPKLGKEQVRAEENVREKFKNVKIVQERLCQWKRFGIGGRFVESAFGQRKGDESVKNIKTEAGVEIGSVNMENVYQVNDSVSACNYDMWN
jgi:hypothetical protein